MNHYPRHIGDWMTATAHLTEVEECIYSRMTDQYYAREAPLPLDVAACCRLVRASTTAARKAVPLILREFFSEQSDGWHQKRCDEELGRFHDRSLVASKSAMLSVEARRKRANAERTLNERTSERSTNAQADVELTSNQNQEPEPIARTTTQPEVASNNKPTSNPLAAGVEKRPRTAEKTPGRTSETAAAYSAAYQDRYGVPPTLNKAVYGHLAQFVDRIGAEESPHVASHFLQSNRGLYVSAKHPTNLLLRDAEALRTEWATRTHGTETEARQIDGTAARGNVWGKLMDEARDGSKG